MCVKFLIKNERIVIFSVFRDFHIMLFSSISWLIFTYSWSPAFLIKRHYIYSHTQKILKSVCHAINRSPTKGIPSHTAYVTVGGPRPGPTITIWMVPFTMDGPFRDHLYYHGWFLRIAFRSITVAARVN